MPKLRNVISGGQAKRRGQFFENVLHGEAYRHGWLAVPIPNGCKQVSAVKLIRVRSPFDFIFVKNKSAIFVDAKTTKANTYSFSGLTPHQVSILSKIEKEGLSAGYIINFSEINKTSFFSGSLISSLTRRSGLRPEDGIDLGDNRIINLNRIFEQKEILCLKQVSQ